MSGVVILWNYSINCLIKMLETTYEKPSICRKYIDFVL